MTEEIPDEAVIQIEVGELDAMLSRYLSNPPEPPVNMPEYTNAYQSGRSDGAMHIHRQIVENADIVIE